jgi:2-C-methyl-D-erythritol 2,4-cyclodiphosphate synthase
VRCSPGRSRQTFRVGTGYDAHRLVEGRRLIICGVRIDHPRGLAGHSDADVGAHALMDALLGAAGLGDLGEHFPDSDPGLRGISSLVLVERVVDVLDREGWAIVNVDVTIVCERPYLAEYRRQMRATLAAALGVEPPAVSVKATTTEGMGFEGRGEGIAAHAACLLTNRD